MLFSFAKKNNRSSSIHLEVNETLRKCATILQLDETSIESSCNSTELRRTIFQLDIMQGFLIYQVFRTKKYIWMSFIWMSVN